MRGVIVFALGMYLGAGLFGGLLMERAIPAFNFIGIGYFMLTWPEAIYCARTSTECTHIEDLPEWAKQTMFTFD